MVACFFLGGVVVHMMPRGLAGSRRLKGSRAKSNAYGCAWGALEVVALGVCVHVFVGIGRLEAPGVYKLRSWWLGSGVDAGAAALGQRQWRQGLFVRSDKVCVDLVLAGATSFFVA